MSNFDFFGNPEFIDITLSNPNGDDLYSLGGIAYNRRIIKRFNAMGEFSFSYPKSIDSGETILPAYEHIKNKKIIKLGNNNGCYQIDNVEETNDGSIAIKNVSCKSLENELIARRVVMFGGTYPLYSTTSPSNSILGKMILLAPNWSVGYVSGELVTKYRTFDVSDTNIYNFLMDEVSKSFECVFVFDTYNRKINAYTLDSATTRTDIFLSFENLVQSSNFVEKCDEITTCLYVAGGGDLNIRDVNPLGTDRMYDFSYYKSTDWMSQSLITAITKWELLIANNQESYSNAFALMKTYTKEILVLKQQLSDLNTELKILETEKAIKIQTNEDYTDVQAKIDAKTIEINGKTTEINNKQAQIDEQNAILVSIHNLVSIDSTSNFTASQRLELDSFIYENTYQNENIIQTSSMTIAEIQEQQEKLYDQAKNILAKVSQPRYEMSIESVNYVMLKDYELFSNQTDVGCIFTIELESGSFVETVLLEISYSFDDPTDFTMSFSNNLRLDNQNYIYSDLLQNINKTGSSVSFDSVKWSDWATNYKNDVSTFITSSLDATTNNLISNNNEEILIDQTGIRGRRYNTDTGTYENEQLWITNNVIAFSDDGFQTSKLALGRITNGSTTTFGLVAESIFGNLIAGNQLTIQNINKDGKTINFILNEEGALLENAKITISNTNTKIIIDPNESNVLSIKKNEGGSFNNKFWVDNAGNVNFSGNLSGATGTFSGSLSAATGTFSGDISGASGKFTGTIYANKLDKSVKVDYSQITNIPASQVSSGTFGGGGYTFAGSAGFANGLISIYQTGSDAVLDSSLNRLRLMGSGGANITVGTSTITVDGATTFGSSIYLPSYASLYVGTAGRSGLTTSVQVTTPTGTKTLYFDHGVLYSIA